MIVDTPHFLTGGQLDGEIATCFECPLEELGGDTCTAWLNDHFGRCPNEVTYTEAIQLAEEATK